METQIWLEQYIYIYRVYDEKTSCSSSKINAISVTDIKNRWIKCV